MILVKFLKSILYNQYHCFPLILTVNKLDSFCHSISFNKKLELIKIFIHHESGIIHANRSPHLPCGLIVVASLGLNFKRLLLTVLIIIR